VSQDDLDDIPYDDSHIPEDFVGRKKQKLYRVLKISPDYESLNSLPKELRTRIVNSGRFQDKTFTVVVLPLSNKEYHLYNTSRYMTTNMLKVLNSHIVPIEQDLRYILKFPMLVKIIIDNIYNISGEVIEEMNKDPQKLFDILKRNREKWASIDSLVDQLLINNIGMDLYMKIEESSEGFDEKLMWASLVELSNDIIIEERYDASKRRRWQIPIKLTPDRNFRKEYQLMTDKGEGMNETFHKTNRALEEAIRMEKRKSDLGIKTRVDTRSENKGLEGV